MSRGSVQECVPPGGERRRPGLGVGEQRVLGVRDAQSELPLTNRDTVSTPAEMNDVTLAGLDGVHRHPEVCSDDAQYRVIVVPGTRSRPSSTATTRPMLKPCSPPGSPQPSIRSSMSSTSSSGTWSSAARMIDRGEVVGAQVFFSDPLKARPIGERVAATMTASGMVNSFVDTASR